MLLNPKAVKAAAACVSDDPCRPALQGVHVQDGKLQATDGHIALTLTETPMRPEDFPAVSGFSHDIPPCIIRPKDLTDALKGIPKRTLIPVLQRLAIGRNGNPNAFELVTTDLDTVNRATVRPIEGPYPNLEQVTPKTAPVFVTGLTVAVVLKLFKALQAAGVEFVRLELHDPMKAMTLHGTGADMLQADAILMPCRIKDPTDGACGFSR